MSERRAELLPSPVPEESRWCLRNYLLRADSAEQVNVSNHNEHVSRLIGEIDQSYLSSEFEYFRTGFVLSHMGQRGICISVWHWGTWGSTHEIFSQAWYTYGRDYGLLRPLDRREPVLCEFEITILVSEFEFFRHTVANNIGHINKEQFMKHIVKL